MVMKHQRHRTKRNSKHGYFNYLWEYDCRKQKTWVHIRFTITAKVGFQTMFVKVMSKLKNQSSNQSRKVIAQLLKYI